MNIFNFFKRAPSITPDEVREFIEHKTPEEYCLLDVRQKFEYERGHLPGARLVPLGELQRRIAELDPLKTFIVYCRTGSRSISGAGLLIGAGFRNVFNMSGGIVQYNGAVASGPPEAGMFCFPENLSPGQLVAVAWFLEDGTLSFLGDVQAGIAPGIGQIVIGELVADKKRHKERLGGLYADITGSSPAPDFPKGVIDMPEEEVMVGCTKVEDALRWSRGKSATDVLELLMSLSANASDLYLKLSRALKPEEARKIFAVLAREEQNNILGIARAFEAALKGARMTSGV
jgi:rhodanese-related sulfurtransferase